MIIEITGDLFYLVIEITGEGFDYFCVAFKNIQNRSGIYLKIHKIFIWTVWIMLMYINRPDGTLNFFWCGSYVIPPYAWSSRSQAECRQSVPLRAALGKRSQCQEGEDPVRPLLSRPFCGSHQLSEEHTEQWGLVCAHLHPKMLTCYTSDRV